MPWTIMLVFLTAGGTYMAESRFHLTNGKRRPRYDLDQFDRQLMERDLRLTSKYRQQSSDAEAPEAFKTNGIWKLEKLSWWKD